MTLKSIFKNQHDKLRIPIRILIFLAIFVGILIFSMMLRLSIENSGILRLEGSLFEVQYSWILTYFMIAFILGGGEFLAVYLMIRVIDRHSFAEIGLTREKGRNDILLGGAIGIGTIAILFLALTFSGHVEWSVSLESAQTLFVYGIVYILFFFIMASTEEIANRGYIFRILLESKRTYLSILVSAGIFALLHAPNNGITELALVNLVLAGILFAQMVLLTGNLNLAIGFHWMWNFSQSYIFGFSVSGFPTNSILKLQLHGPDWLTGGVFGLEGGLPDTIATSLLILFIHWKLSKSSDRHIA